MGDLSKAIFLLDNITDNMECFSRRKNKMSKLDIEAETLKPLIAAIESLTKRVKRLEQTQTYYPFTEEELAREKVGGTD